MRGGAVTIRVELIRAHGAGSRTNRRLGCVDIESEVFSMPVMPPQRPSRIRRFSGGAVVAITLFGGGTIAAASTAGAVTGVPSDVLRVSGASRLDTAIAASKDQFAAAGSAKAVVLARSDNFPDALAGGPLAAKVGGPLLLTSTAALDASVKAEIVRVAPAGAPVYVLGGTSAVSQSVVTTLTGLGFVVTRLSGADRFATAVAVADAVGDPTTVFEATGLNFPDALAGGPAAIKTGGVILLTNGSAQSPATAAYLAAHAGGTHYALGGPAATADPTATPLAGDDRYWTASAVASQFFPTATTVGVVTGGNFPDALAAGADLASKNAPLLLVPTSGPLPAGVVTALFGTARTLTNAIVYGGTASVSDDVATQVGVLANATARALTANTSAAFTGQFGVLAQKVTVSGLAGVQTVAVDATSGDATIYKPSVTTQTIPGGFVPRAQVAALPLDPDALIAAVNALFAADDADLGVTDPDELFILNAEGIVLDPVTPPSVRYAMYAALESDNGFTDVNAGAKDSTGRPGIEIFAATGADATDKSKISFIFDPNTFLPLEDTTYDAAGAVVTRATVTSLTTVATLPANPYAP
jgi:putative cell wall-binding protein